jgi:hypothetical protein
MLAVAGSLLRGCVVCTAEELLSSAVELKVLGTQKP